MVTISATTIIIICFLPISLTTPDNPEIHETYHESYLNLRCQCLPPNLGEYSVNESHNQDVPELISSRINCSDESMWCCKQKKITCLSATEAHEFSWNLILLSSLRNGDEEKLPCGSTLIHPMVVLTAAHCVEAFTEIPSRILVRTNDWNTTKSPQEIRLPYRYRFVESITIHQDYYINTDTSHLINDIALLFINESFDVTDKVRPVCLPDETSDPTIMDNCVVNAWKNDTEVPKKMNVSLVSRNECIFFNFWFKEDFVLHHSFLCARTEMGTDDCIGDGGSPLTCRNNKNGNFVQVGIIGLGSGCEEIPGIYVSVPAFWTWIKQQLTDKGLSIDSNGYFY